jgi:hypothetical protein
VDHLHHLLQQPDEEEEPKEGFEEIQDMSEVEDN